VPGFSHGIKTGEYVDVAKLFGGRPNPKKSGNPHSIDELINGKVVSTKRKTQLLFAKIARKDYSNRKRTSSRSQHAPVTNNTLPPPCNRRFFEWFGDHCAWMDYSEQPELFISNAKVAYEVTDGLLPMLTTTSAREALIMCATFAQHGIATYFNRVVIPR